MTLTSIPNGLIREIADRRCIIFLGAGATMAAESAPSSSAAPSWTELLKLLAERVSAVRDDVTHYVEQNRPLDAAQVIRSNIGATDYRDVLRDAFEAPGLTAGHLHRLVNSIDPKIVMTTNYDSVYEDYCNSGRAKEELAYRTKHYYDQDLLDDVRSPNSLILKLHGSVAAPAKTVLSRRDYFRARTEYPGFFTAVKALLLTHTVLFVGCSIDTDPHIQLFFEWASSALHQEIKHFAIVPKIHGESVYGALSETLNVEFITYPYGDHGEVVKYLEDIEERVTQLRAGGLGM